MPSSPTIPLVNKVRLPQRQPLRRLRRTNHAVSLHYIRLRIDSHLRPHIVELHIPLANRSAILDRFDAFAEIVRGGDARRDGRLADKGDAGGGQEGREHGAHDDRLDGGDGGVGITLVTISGELRKGIIATCHLCVRAESALDYQLWFDTKV